ncbi:MAG: ribonuclease III [Phycisphaerae bacterium]|nr:ribonuclease III [Phycisphaerae bacterium]
MPSKRSSTASSTGKVSGPKKKTARKPAAKRPRAGATGPARGSDPKLHDERFVLIGHVFSDPALMQLALTHASVSDTRMVSNERLEFLGDAVLGQIICEHLYQRYPDRLEGDLTKLKSHLVSRDMCAQLVRDAGFHRLMSIGKGMISVEALPKSVLAGLFESLVGAIFLDGGGDAARAFVMRHMEPHIERTLQSGHQENYKSVLQQLAQQAGLGSPTYSVLDERGPDHEKNFEIRAQIGDRAFASCWGMSKKAAEQGAALHALRELGFVIDGPSGPQVQVPQPIAETMP